MSEKDELVALWQGAPEERPVVSLADIRARSAKLERTIAFRNAREYIAGGVGAVSFGALFVVMDDVLYRVGCALLLAGIAYVVYRLHRYGHAPKPIDEAAPAAEHLAHLRRELVRQRDLLQNVFVWYVAPFIPGIATLLVAAARMPGHHGETYRLIAALVSALFNVAIFTGVVLLNKWGARKLDAQIRALDDQESQAIVTPSPPSPG